MSAEDKYFSHKLCALSYGEITEDRFEHIISGAIVDAGAKAWEKLEDDDREEKQEWILKATKAPSDFKKNKDAHWAVMYGATILNVQPGSVEACLRRSNELTAYVNWFESMHGTDPTVRVKADFVWRAKNQTFAYRNYSVLAAVYSVIGENERPVLIGRNMIRCRALGYKTPAVMAKPGIVRKDGLIPLTVKQIRITLDNLEQLNYFCRMNPAPKSRRAYFSHRLTREQMISALAEKEFHRRKLSVTKISAANQVQELVESKLKAIVLSGPILSGPSLPKRGRTRAKKGPVRGQTGASEGPLK